MKNQNFSIDSDKVILITKDSIQPLILQLMGICLEILNFQYTADVDQKIQRSNV